MKEKNRLWNIVIAACLVLLIGAGVCEVLFFSEKPATVTVDSVAPAELSGSAASVSDAERALPAVTETAAGEPEQLTGSFAETAAPDRNLNTADEAALKRVSGVGNVLAERILAYRSGIGGFTRRAQLLEIEGVGEKIAERILEEFYIPDELPPETTAPQTTAENRTTAARTESSRTTTAKTTAETVTETEPVLPPKRNINSVTEEELLEIPGMNETRAEAVLKLREELGRFRDLRELTYCEGLSGDYIVNTLFLYLTLDDGEESAEP